jgi:hypothetical protein
MRDQKVRRDQRQQIEPRVVCVGRVTKRQIEVDIRSERRNHGRRVADQDPGAVPNPKSVQVLLKDSGSGPVLLNKKDLGRTTAETLEAERPGPSEEVEYS